MSVLFSNVPNKAFLVPISCIAMVKNGNNIIADVVEDIIIMTLVIIQYLVIA